MKINNGKKTKCTEVSIHAEPRAIEHVDIRKNTVLPPENHQQMLFPPWSSQHAAYIMNRYNKRLYKN